MKKSDWFLIVTVIILSGLGITFFVFRNTGNYAKVYYDGRLLDKINLSIDRDYTYQFEDNINTIRVQNNEVCMLDSNCPNQDCVYVGYISKDKQTIVCLPHKLSVVISSSESEYDYIE